MLLALFEETRIWIAQKGAKHEDTSSRGCSWYAGPNYCSQNDSKEACALIDGLKAKHPFVDRGYDS